MKTSEHINELATALNKAQSEMTGAKKSSKNPFFKSTYSDLSSVMSAISIPFANNGLSFIQSPEFNDNKIEVITRIMHNSGQWIEGACTLPPTKNDAPGYGSAITYAKRYGLQAMAGVPSVDDDGQEAVKQNRIIDWTDQIIQLRDCKTMPELAEAWKAVPVDAKEGLQHVKDELKALLEGKS